MVGWLVNNELGRKVKDWLLACCNAMRRQLSGLTEKNHETLGTVVVPTETLM